MLFLLDYTFYTLYNYSETNIKRQSKDSKTEKMTIPPSEPKIKGTVVSAHTIRPIASVNSLIEIESCHSAANPAKIPDALGLFPPVKNLVQLNLTAELQQEVATQQSMSWTSGNQVTEYTLNFENLVEFECDHCGNSYMRKPHLRRHILNHRTIKQYNCKVCQMRFRRNDVIKNHEATHHDRNSGFECSICSKFFKKRYNLMKHKETHTTLRAYSCPTCLKAFKTQDSLRHHVKIHLLIRKFICFCGSAFKRKDHLKKHKLRIHS